MLVVEVYNKAEWEISSEENNAESRARKSMFFILYHGLNYSLTSFVLYAERLIEILREFPPEEPSRKRYITEMINWSSKFGPLERGDPELHHAAGSVYAEGIPFLSRICSIMSQRLKRTSN